MTSILKILLSLLMIAYLFTHMHLHEVLHTIQQTQLLWYSLALGSLLLGTLCAAYRWQRIMQLLSFKRNFPFFCKSYFKGCLFSQFLPTSIGGDAYRVFELGAADDFNKTQAFYGIFIDRVYGSLGLMLINLVANCWSTIPLPQGMSWMINIIAGLGLLAWILLLQFHRIPWLSKLRLLKFIHALSIASNQSFSSLADMLGKFGLSILANLLTVVSFYSVGLSLQLPYPFIDYLLIVPLVNLILLLPISMAGWGLREGAMVGLFSLVGANKAQIMALSLLLGFVTMLNALPGLYFWLRTRKTSAHHAMNPITTTEAKNQIAST